MALRSATPSLSVLKLAARLLGHGPGIVMREVTACRFEAAGPVTCQIDGDTFGTVESNADYEVDDISELIEIIRNENKVRIS